MAEKEFKEYPQVGKVYKHYKGVMYQVLTLATHSETQEVLVIYRSLHFGSVHARPLQNWFDDVDDSNKMKVKRFSLAE